MAAADAAGAVTAAWPRALRLLKRKRFDRVFLVAAGKAASAMASAVGRETVLTGGIIVTKYGHALNTKGSLQVFEAGHPIPDEAGVLAAKRVQGLLRELNARDLLIFALSGGASSLLPSPVDSVPLADKQITTGMLLRAGANIQELNVVRKHLSSLKGGRLAALAYPATVLGLILSDVIGDPLDVIGSGPTAPDPTTFEDARAVLRKFQIEAPKSVSRYLESAVEERPNFDHVYNLVVGSNRIALKASAERAKKLGYRSLVLTSSLQGEARELGRMHAAILREAAGQGKRICFLSGGEPTVTVRGGGKGGRAQELTLAAAIDLAGAEPCLLLSAGTDGTDGPTDAAGAFASPATLAQAASFGLDPAAYLLDNDSYYFFERLGGLFKTGPTGTNVMDLNVMLTGQFKKA